MDYYVPQVLTDPLYYPDGQILDEVYVYGSFIQSKKFLQGVRCTDCHNPHTARLHTNGNALCMDCHGSPPPKQYTNLQDKDYDSPAHHFHKENSEGAQCVECHMPEKKYMIVDPRRDHKFQIPRPDLSVKLDIPNPCNRCHHDKSVKWAASKVDAWYPLSREKRMAERHIAEFFAAGQAGDLEAVPRLINVAKDRAQPPIIQATALNILSRSPSQQALDTMASSLKHEDPLVRYEAVKGVSVMLPGSLGAEYQRKKLDLLAPRLKDPIRAVRSEAARGLTDVPGEVFDEAQMQEFEKGLEEYKARQKAIADRPEAHLNLGLMYQNLGKDALAEASYKDAIRLVPDFIPVRFNLAHLYNGMGRNDEARQMFREIIGLESENGDAHYSLGLLLAEMSRLEEAGHSLKKAVELLPDRARVRYNYALTLRHLGRSQEAEQAMHQAYTIDPKDPGVLHAITVFYMQERQWEKALSYAEKLVALAPAAPGPRQLMQEIEKELGGRGQQSIQ
jgi:predicted CXXCH cytochrome family protein